MSKFLNSAIKFILDFRAAAGDFIGPHLYIFQIISLVVSGAFLWGIIYCISRSGWLVKRKEEWMDKLGIGDVGRSRQLRAWKQIVEKIKTNEMANWKMAILESDRILDDILKGSGYRADTTDERMKQLAPEALTNAKEIQEAHRVRNRIAQEPDFTITKDEALSTLKIYKKSFQEFGVLD